MKNSVLCINNSLPYKFYRCSRQNYNPMGGAREFDDRENWPAVVQETLKEKIVEIDAWLAQTNNR